MAIAFRASVSNEQTASGTDVQVTIPATVQAGDAMVAVWSAAGTSSTVTTPAGWNLEAGPVDKGTVIREYVFSRVAQAGDAGSTFVITKSVSDATKRYISLVAYSGTHGTTPVQAITSAVESVAGTSHTGAAATATGTGCWLLQHASDRGSPASTDITPPAGQTERVEQVGTGSGTMTVEFSDSNGAVAAGSVGAVSWTGTVSTANAITWTIVLQPLAGTSATATPSVITGAVPTVGGVYSVWITSVTVIGVLVFATLSGYAFAKLDFPFRNTLFVLLLTTLMMPSTALIIPLYLELKSLGLLDSQAGLLVLYISGSAPFAMFLMRAFFQTLPDELIEAARVDGGSELTIFRRVILPLTRPGIATVVIFQFLSTWNEFLIANTVLRNTESLPLQPVLFTLMGQYSTNWPALTAGLTLSVVPVVIVYVRMQRQFVAGMMLGAVKN